MSQGAIRAGRAEILLRIRDQTRQGLSGAQRSLNRFALRTSLIGAGLGGATLGGGRLFAGFTREFARVEQLLGRFDSVLGGLSDSSGQFADTLAGKINQSGLAIRDTLAQFQAIGQGQGFSPEQANAISRELARATEDLIAFDDTIANSQEAVTKLFAVFTGETEPLRKFGADFRKQALDVEGAASRFGPAAESFSQSQRETLARLEQFRNRALASGITGQAEREVNTLSAQMRGLGAAVTDTTAAIGGTFGPQLAALTGVVSQTVRGFGEFATQNERIFQLAAVGVPVLGAVAGSFIAVGVGAQVLSFSLAGVVGTFTFVAGLGATIASAFGPVPVVLAGVGAGLVALSTNVGGSRDAITSALSSIAGQFSGLRKVGTETFDGIADALAASDLQGAGQIALLGLELAFRENTQSITSVWNGFVDGIVLTFTDRFADVENIATRASGFIAKTFANAFLAPGEAAAVGAAIDLKTNDSVNETNKTRERDLANIQEARRQEEDAAREKLSTLKTEFDQRRKNAQVAREEFELAQQAAAKTTPSDLVASVEASSARSQGTFGGGEVSRQFAPSVDKLREVVAASRENVAVNKKILANLQNTPVLRYA